MRWKFAFWSNMAHRTEGSNTKLGEAWPSAAFDPSWVTPPQTLGDALVGQMPKQMSATPAPSRVFWGWCTWSFSYWLWICTCQLGIQHHAERVQRYRQPVPSDDRTDIDFMWPRRSTLATDNNPAERA